MSDPKHFSAQRSAPALRLERLDALRGFAMLWMATFHFCFDLSHYGLLAGQNFYRDPLWIWQRVCIVSLFLCCAGTGQALALQGPAGWASARFWRRWGQIAACALLVSIGSYWMFPRSFITFGVLHAVALMLLLLRLLAPLPSVWLFGLALLALLLPHGLQSPFFDTRWTNWVGLVTHKPITEDYVPLLPWLGVMLLGLLLGRCVLQGGAGVAWLAGALPRGLHPLAVLGRWPLSFYMLHQPVLIGLIMAGLALR
ncbi:MAG: hypothetical protein RLY71_2617 [Pseudomonadota bacterium]|jgi:uncharacterized membrane protein